MPHFIFIQQISVLSILNMLYNLHFFSSKCRFLHNATSFGFCITHILNTGCAKIWKKNPSSKGSAVATGFLRPQIRRKPRPQTHNGNRPFYVRHSVCLMVATYFFLQQMNIVASDIYKIGETMDEANCMSLDLVLPSSWALIPFCLVTDRPWKRPSVY